MTTMRRAAGLGAVAALLTAYLWAGALITTPGDVGPDAVAATPGALTVTPATGLVDGQVVDITFPSGVTGAVDLALCPTASDDPDGCLTLAYDVSSGVDVALPAIFYARSAGGTLSSVDCRVTACSLEASTLDGEGDLVVVARGAVGFDPAAPLRTAPTIAADPVTDLVDGQSIEVSVTPAQRQDPSTAASGATVLQCARPLATITGPQDIASICSLDSIRQISGPDGGTATGDFPVSAFVGTSAGIVDCRLAASECVVATVDPVAQTADVALHFDPDGPADPVVIQRYDPDVDATSTTYDMAGFTPGDSFVLTWCSDERCLPDTLASGTLDEHGAGSFTILDESLDLPDRPDTCDITWSLTVVDGHGLQVGLNWAVAVACEQPSGPFTSQHLPVQVDPHKGLTDGQNVTVTASGFAPGAQLSIVECTGAALSRGELACDLSTSSALRDDTGILQADAQGNLTADYQVSRFIDVDGQRVDCRDGNIDPDAFAAGVAEDPSRVGVLDDPAYSTCIVAVADLDDYSMSGGTPIAFEGAQFRALPWQSTAGPIPPGLEPIVKDRTVQRAPEAPPAVAPAAPAANAVAAQPTFTG